MVFKQKDLVTCMVSNTLKYNVFLLSSRFKNRFFPHKQFGSLELSSVLYHWRETKSPSNFFFYKKNLREKNAVLFL